MSSNTSLNSEDSDVFFVEQISNEPSPQRNNSPNILNSTEISHTHTAPRKLSVSSIAFPEPQILTNHDNSNESTMPYGFGRQLPIVPPSLNDLNLPPNPFNILATMAVVNHTEDENNNNYSPHSHQSHLIHRPSQHHQRTSVILTVGKHRTPQLTTTPSIRRTSHDVYTGPLPWTEPFIRKANPVDYPYCPVHHRRQLLACWKRS